MLCCEKNNYNGVTGFSTPCGNKLMPMRRINFFQLATDKIDFTGFCLSSQFTPHATKAVIDEIGINDIGFTIVANPGNATRVRVKAVGNLHA